MITIGNMSFGPEIRGTAIHRTILAAMRLISDLRSESDFGKIPSLNDVYMIPGSILTPDFIGQRTGKFSNKEKMLMIQIAVPSGLNKFVDCKEFVINSLYAANELAYETFKKKKMDFDLIKANKLIQEIEPLIEHEARTFKFKWEEQPQE